MSSSSSFVNPSSISEAGPSRKRPRSDMSSEERKEARAHRNRIAAQNSRDRRKAQFSQLERRVQELEEENRQLRAGYGLAQQPTASKSPEQEARDRENEELRERIKTLEKGWDAVVKALAAQGLPGLSAPDSSSTSTPPPPPPSTSESKPISHEHPQIVPLSPAPSSIDEEDSPMFSADSTEYSSSPSPEIKSTRHLAAGGLDSLDVFSPFPFPQTPSDLPDSAVPPVDDAAMETLFLEILATSPTSTRETPLFSPESEASVATPEVKVTFEGGAGKGTPGSLLLSGPPEDLAWPHEELDVQKLLDLLPPVDTTPLDNWEFSLENTAVGVY